MIVPIDTTVDPEIDVPLDWLYKAKRQSKSKTSKVLKSIEKQRQQQRAATTTAEASPLDAAPPTSPQRQRSRSSSLSSALKTTTTTTMTKIKRSNSLNEKPKKSSLFGSLFGRRSSSVTASQQPRHLSNDLTKIDSETITSDFTTLESTPIYLDTFDTSPESESSADSSLIEKLSKTPLHRVTFAVDKFENDPPQQLPSRNPKIGNILIPNDMISKVPSICLGIANSTSAKDGKPTFITSSKPKYTKDSIEYKVALERHNKFLKEANRHQEEAHHTAERTAQEVRIYRTTNVNTTKNNDASLSTIERKNINEIEIDKPIHMHEYHFGKDEESKLPLHKITLETIYTRCCHLREILPIPSSLKQVKGKTGPLEVLKFLNPKPTLVDILSFCDFIAIVPIYTIIFDNVLLTSEMFQIVLKSLVNSKVLQKLGLRNVVINKNDWKLLCQFLLHNKSLIKLDISQTRVRTESDSSSHRENMDWILFAQALQHRDGAPLEELLLNGIKISQVPIEHLKGVLTTMSEKAQTSSVTNGLRLGLAATDLNQSRLDIVMDWMLDDKVQGVDLSFNNLQDLMRPMIYKLSFQSYNHLMYFTLNNTAITNVNDTVLLLKYLSKLENLQFLDLSNLSSIFPEIFPYLNKYLPRFPKLKRIHFDQNSLTYRQIIVLCNILVKCKGLYHISLLSTHQESPSEDETTVLPDAPAFSATALWTALYTMARDLPNLLTLDINYDKIPEEMQSRIALGLMRNMQRAVDSNFKIDDLSSQDDLLFDGSLLTETADEVLKKFNGNVASLTYSKKEDATKKYLLKKYFEKLNGTIFNIQETIDSIVEKRKNDELTSKEKENLLRLLLLKKNLINILEIFSHIPNFAEVTSQLSLAGTHAASSPQPVRPGIKRIDSDRLLWQVGNIEADSELRESRPHVMATDLNAVIDIDTGKPVLFRTQSSTSVAGKRQEEEEGELHKWGTFLQQNDGKASNMFNDTVSKFQYDSSTVINEMIPESPLYENENSMMQRDFTSSSPKILTKIPTGEELRNAIIKTKGIDSIDELIQNVGENNRELENIYDLALNLNSSSSQRDEAPRSLTVETRQNKHLETILQDDLSHVHI
ncbi:hypothetical protein KAFR_0G01880 [Kazachstania africana CBS 2517]|uniref:GLC7-interacting protein 3 n=1 Tax=Kazachstania africana (strain ATCC 22294 / BCRC 22015 / CBS 2517 / CECT 1963 / NBRC 1671 / NRRL Y-8276) TaxID=1071382 RepID=H2AXX2_KAZAF|nr:hypothetical protein KAFR_0G01880 [Kazachstania africana CBS 2517]CCF59222.1 hypothetical protein KAFR_0G01880 [Kazachstania africana CBS 2517]